MRLVVLACFAVIINYVVSSPEQGIWTEELTKESSQVFFTKSLYQGTDIKVKLFCQNRASSKVGSKMKVQVRFLGRIAQCLGEFNGIGEESTIGEDVLARVNAPFFNDERAFFFVDADADKNWYECDNNYITLTDHSDADWQAIKNDSVTEDAVDAEPKKSAAPVKETESDEAQSASEETETKKETPTKSVKKGLTEKSRSKRSARNLGKKALLTDKKTASLNSQNGSQTPATVDSNAVVENAATNNDLHRIAVAKVDGIYLFVFMFDCAVFDAKSGEKQLDDLSCDFSISMTLEMHHEKYGYLGAIDWPQLPFYATMCAIYSVYTLAWLVLCVCYWRDLIRLQFWIAGVIVLGLVEKSIFVAEYQSVYYTGLSVLPGALVIAEIVSALKRTLARILIVIVSVGFGIVRPRLGPIFSRVMVIGVLYFICATIEGCSRQLNPKGSDSMLALFSVFPLALIDAILCCWIFTSLVQTIRQLRVRRNIVKLSLYKHFTNVLIFAVLASLVYMVWSAVEHKFVKCLLDWKELWMDEAFWQMLFSTILLVTIVLFRPSNNAVKYSFQPLLDADEDAEDGEEVDEVIMTNLSEDVKKKQRIGDKDKDRENAKMQTSARADNDDLKWVEENIPVTEGMLPSLLDSDEEIMASKYERNKME